MSYKITVLKGHSEIRSSISNNESEAIARAIAELPQEETKAGATSIEVVDVASGKTVFVVGQREPKVADRNN